MMVGEFNPFEIAAVNQCSRNSRGSFSPRVPGGEWADGAMGNALWKGVRLKDVLDRAGVKAGALQARFNGLDPPSGRSAYRLPPSLIERLSTTRLSPAALLAMRIASRKSQSLVTNPRNTTAPFSTDTVTCSS
jgi:DMSO/TMAO reductase YedYZ molybdopterin-dependent catalytic subunit